MLFFVGGATISLYSWIDVSPEVRPTEDVDVVVEVYTKSDYAVLEEKTKGS